MRWRIVLSVFRKEMRETLRDRRTLTMMIGLPLVLYPMMILATSNLAESRRDSEESKSSAVAVWGDLPDAMRERLARNKIELKTWDGMPGPLREQLTSGTLAAMPEPPAGSAKKAEAKKTRRPDHPLTAAARPLILDRKADAVLVVWPNVAASRDSGGLGNVSILFDSVRDGSKMAERRLNEEIAAYRRDLLADREKARGLPAGFTRGLAVVPGDVATQERRTGFGLGQLLPFLLITVTFSGAFYAAIDTTAGEKERGTLQTLLCAPVASHEIIGGKFLSVWTVALVSATANVVSLSLTLSQVIKNIGGGAAIPASAYGIALAMLIPVSLMVTALFLAVGVFAKDFKDGQNFLTPVLLAVMVPSGVAMVPGMELSPGTAFLPIVNIALLMKSMFLAEASGDLIFLVLVASALYAALAVLFAARVFEREAILLGGKDTARGLFGIDRLAGARPTPSLGIALFTVCLVLAFYASMLLPRIGLPAMLLAMQYGCFLLPAAALVYGLRFPAAETLRLRMPGWRGLAAGLIVGATGWTVAFQLARLAPPPESLQKALERFVLMDGKIDNLFLLVFLIAVTPAICEEILFRGMLLSSFKRLGAVGAVTLSAVLFGLAHASIYRILPTLLLGLLFGYLAWRTESIVPSMIAHAVNNGLIAVSLARPEWFAGLDAETIMTLPAWISGVGAMMIVAALWLVTPRRGVSPSAVS